MKSRTVGLLFGFTFVAAGLLGFTPNALVEYDGFFVVNAVHSLVHLLTGGVFIFSIIRYPGYEALIIKLVGVAYVTVSVLGFLTSGNMLLGIVHINEADRWLHFGLAIVILAAGFAFSDNKTKLSAHSVDIS